ncbi:MAG: hypothetical protein ACLP4V_00855 [Methylocella sp.]
MNRVYYKKISASSGGVDDQPAIFVNAKDGVFGALNPSETEMDSRRTNEEITPGDMPHHCYRHLSARPLDEGDWHGHCRLPKLRPGHDAVY